MFAVAISNDSLQDAEVTYRVWEAGKPGLLVEGAFISPANQNWQVAEIPLAGDAPRLFLLEWQVGAGALWQPLLERRPSAGFCVIPPMAA